jgi:hypothetical protein
VDVLGGEDDHARVDLVPCAHVARRGSAEQLLRRLFGPQRLERHPLEVGEREAHERIGTTPGQCADERLDQRPGKGRRHDHHLPARLDAERAPDEQLGQLLDPRRVRVHSVL